MSAQRDDPCDLTGLERLLPHATARAAELSAWTVGEHVEHCVLALLGIAQRVGESTPPVPPAGLALRRRVILATGRIPRGKARAPGGAVPAEPPDEAHLRMRLDDARGAVTTLRAAPRDGWFRHFALGPMDRDTCLRFLRIHNRHHARIARDIIAAG